MICLGLVVTAFWAAPAPAAEKSPSPPNAENRKARGETVVVGKLTSSLKHVVLLPFQAEITSLAVQTGEPVKKGEVLAEYRLRPEAVFNIRQRLVSNRIKELEARQAVLAHKQAELQQKSQSLKKLAQDRLASAQSLAQLERERKSLAQEQAAVQEQLRGERQVQQDYLGLLREQLGRPVSLNHLPTEGVLAAPLTGNIVWINPEMRIGAYMKAMEPVFQVGVLDPMVVKAQVHEMEAVHLKVGNSAQLSLEALPGQKFSVEVSRVAFTPLTGAPDQPSYYEVEFTVANPSLSLREGLKGKVVLPLPTPAGGEARAQ